MQQSFHGLREASCVVRGVPLDHPLKTLLEVVFVHQPRLTGWPPWVDSSSFRDCGTHPYVKEKGWEAIIYGIRTHWSVKELDFWRIEPTGRFYTARTYEDDTSKSLLNRGAKPGTILDFVLLITRTAEIIATVRAFVDGLEVDREKALLEFARWTGLKGREICCWVQPGQEYLHFWCRRGRCRNHNDCDTTESPDTAIWESVKCVTQQLVFDVFAAGVGDPIFEDLVNRTLKRQL